MFRPAETALLVLMNHCWCIVSVAVGLKQVVQCKMLHMPRGIKI